MKFREFPLDGDVDESCGEFDGGLGLSVLGVIDSYKALGCIEVCILGILDGGETMYRLGAALSSSGLNLDLRREQK